MKWIAVLVALFSVSAQAQPRSVAEDALVFFNSVCLEAYPYPDRFQQWVIRQPLRQLPPEVSAGLIKEPEGRAYSVEYGDNVFLVATGADNRCALYVKEVDQDEMRQAFEKLRNTIRGNNIVEQIKSRSQQVPGGEIKFIDYQYSVGKNWMMTLTLTEAWAISGFYQWSVSVKSKLRANNMRGR